MTQPNVTITELDGALGVLPPSAGRLMAFVGPSTTGPLNTPATYARVKDIVADFGAGPLVEQAAYYVDVIGRPVVIVRTAQSVAATVGAVTHTGTGTSVATIAASPTPFDDYELVLAFPTGGTIAVAGITYQESYDGGRTFGPLKSLGTADEISIGGVTFEFAAGTIVSGDTYAARATAAKWNPAELTDALNALGDSVLAWEQLVIVGAIDATSFDNVETKIVALEAKGRYYSWIAGARIPNAGETEAAYLTALSGIFGTKSTSHGTVCAGAAKITSGVSGRKYRRPVTFAVSIAQGGVTEEIDIADINLGSLSGVSIRDANGNVDEHDESVNPGLDDARFTVLRTWDGYPGVYVNRPRIFSAPGSDFELIPHRRVMNLAKQNLRAYLVRRLNKPIRIDRATGFILETEALEIEAGALGVMRAVLLAKPKASAVQFTLSRVDVVLSTKTLTGSARIVPLGYPEFINADIGYYNPALAFQQAA